MNDELKQTGLSAETIKKINTVFAHYPDIGIVKLYGSRAKGNYRQGSDIDLAIMGDGLSAAILLRIEKELDDLLLPYKIDLCLFRTIRNGEFRDHIERVGIVFYCRA